MENLSKLPDVSAESKAEIGLPIQWVGMSGLRLPALTMTSLGPVLVPAEVHVGVSLDEAHVRGIHMSRLHQRVSEQLRTNDLSFAHLKKILHDGIEDQKGLGAGGRIDVAWEVMTEQKALKSNETGYRYYPVKLSVERRKNEWRYHMQVEILYSSTCPCSAALARQLNADRWREEFDGRNSVSAGEIYDWLLSEPSVAGTPHAQRSVGKVHLAFNDGEFAPKPLEIIKLLENAVKTPVQTAVKREDEQEFARLNAENLLFCEDAVRRLAQAVDSEPRISGYWIRVDHQESLHPHAASAEISKSWS